MTVRQVFYRMVSHGVIPKTEGAYKDLVVDGLSDMRRRGELPYEWLADSTRWMRRIENHAGLEALLADVRKTYRRDLWRDQEYYCEVWLEKEALAGVLFEETCEWQVPLMVTRGYPSLSYIHSAAMAIRDAGKPCKLFYFGDYDPSGMDIPRVLERDLRALAPDADLTFKRVAVNEEDIEWYDLPTRPTKKSDSRAKGFVGESVEVDAFEPAQLRQMVKDCIESCIDPVALAATKRIEQAEIDSLAALRIPGA